MSGPRETTIRISEIFGPTIQGEGLLIGLPTVFVRTGGCDYRCSWCDTLHAVDSEYRDQWAPMNVDAIWQEITRLSGGKPITVSLSGGNPAIQPLGGLIERGHDEGYRFALETQGSVAKPWFSDLDYLVLSPKPPSSGMATDWNVSTTVFPRQPANRKSRSRSSCSMMRIMPMLNRLRGGIRNCRSIFSLAITPRRHR